MSLHAYPSISWTSLCGSSIIGAVIDLPVLFIKLRDYVLWVGPLYMVAICLSALYEVVASRLLTPPRNSNSLAQPQEAPTQPVTIPLYKGLWRLLGYRERPLAMPVHLFVWLTVSAQATTWVGLLMTTALGWPLALLRVGSSLVMASLLALLAPTIFYGARVRVDSPGDSATRAVPPGPMHSVLAQWWQAVKRGFDSSSNIALAGVALGAVVIAATPALQSLLRGLPGPVAYLVGSVAGTLTNLVPGTDAPLLAALQARGAPGLGTSLMLAVSVAPLGIVRQFGRRFGLRAAALYLAAAWSLCSAAAALIELLIQGAGI